MKTPFAIALSLGLAFGAATAIQAADQPATAMTADQSAQPGSDGWITTKVKSELMATKGIPSTKISVTTTNGVVMLSGVVENKAQLQKAVAVAKGVKGVHSVDASALTSAQ
jgi:hyperosmotically inducible protein